MSAKLLTGKEVAQKMDQDIQAEVQALKGKGINPALRIMTPGLVENSERLLVGVVADKQATEAYGFLAQFIHGSNDLIGWTRHNEIGDREQICASPLLLADEVDRVAERRLEIRAAVEGSREELHHLPHPFPH